MKYVDKIMQARAFMGQSDSIKTSNKCTCCGEMTGSLKIKKELKNTFCNFDEIMLFGSGMICPSCCKILNDKDMRFKPILYKEKGVKIIPERESILRIIENPYDKFVLSLPYSFKKHHWLYAGMSNKHCAYIGTDNRTVVIDYDNYDIKLIVDTITMLVNAGVPRKELTVGRYSTFTRAKFNDIDNYEKLIYPVRKYGLAELIVKYTPAVTKKLEIGKGDDVMLSESEKKAVDIIASIAKESEFRMEEGIRFWGGYYERRINRIKTLDLHEFASKLCDAVSARHTDIGIENISEDDEKKIMDDIRGKTNLIVSLAYTEIKTHKKIGTERKEENTNELDF